MIKRILAGAIYVSACLAVANVTTHASEPASLTCYFQSGENFTVVGTDSNTIIQWGKNAFRQASAKFDKPWLLVMQEYDGNVFKMAFNVVTLEAYGETTFKDGTKKGGPLWCAFK